MTVGKVAKAAMKMSLPLLVVASALPVFGSGVDFNTTGVFTCGIHTVGCTTSTNHPTPAGGVNTAGLTFTLNINQTDPNISPTSGSLLGSFSGSIDARGSNTVVNFASNQTSLTLGGGITYTLDFLNPGQNSWTIPNPGIGKTGVTTETATIGSLAPEPSFLILSGFGFAGLAFVAYRRRQKVSV